MYTLRTDPEGAWRNKEVHERLSDMPIVLDLHPGEASWQASVTENTIGIVKDMMTRIGMERPDLKPSEVLAADVLVHNEMERVRGFSPAQRALGRAPNWDQSFFDCGNETPDPSFLEHLQGTETATDAWLKSRNEERLKRAKNGPLAHFRPGDEVDFWRRGKGTHIKDRFHGRAVVLATSTEIDEEDGSRKPLENMGQAQRLPWTHEVLHGWLRKGQHEDLSMDAPPDEDKTDDEPGLEDDSSAAWEHEKRQVKRKLEYSRVPRVASRVQRGKALLSQTEKKPVRKVSKQPAKSSKAKTTSRFFEHGRNEQRITTKAFCEPTGTVRGKISEKKGESRWA